MTLTEEQIAEIRARAEAAINSAQWGSFRAEDAVLIKHDVTTLLAALEAAEKRAEDAERADQAHRMRLTEVSIEYAEHCCDATKIIAELKAERDTLRAEVDRLREAARGATVITNTAADEIRRLREKVERLREGLDAKAAIFEAYATMHRDKGTREGFAKAAANERHAADCRALTKKEAGDES